METPETKQNSEIFEKPDGVSEVIGPLDEYCDGFCYECDGGCVREDGG
jgi:hypothetical protein